MPRPSSVLRVALLADYREEAWPSMDLIADMLYQSLSRQPNLQVSLVCPPLSRYAQRIAPHWSAARNADRLIGRLFAYPRYLNNLAASFDVFHLVDHSYSQLLHVIPPNRTVITCHDIDTFRAVLEPAQTQRPWWFRKMTAHILAGFRLASHVVCVSEDTRRQLLNYGLGPAQRLSVMPNGVSPEYFQPPSSGDMEWAQVWFSQQGIDPGQSLLHVGSTIARKRVDILLRVLAAACTSHPQLRLLRVGGPFTPDQRQLACELGIENRIHFLPFLERPQLNALYRLCLGVIQTSSYEGFGLPVAEALAAGAFVIASDIPILREIGGPHPLFADLENIPAWTAQIDHLVNLASTQPQQMVELRHQAQLWARRYQWDQVAARLTSLYQNL